MKILLSQFHFRLCGFHLVFLVAIQVKLNKKTCDLDSSLLWFKYGTSWLFMLCL